MQICGLSSDKQFPEFLAKFSLFKVEDVAMRRQIAQQQQPDRWEVIDIIRRAH
jgi:hypothetical protein